MGGIIRILRNNSISQGEMLKKIQKEKEYTVVKLANESGCSERSIIRYRNQKSDLPKEAVEKLARALGVDKMEITSIVKRSEEYLKKQGLVLLDEDELLKKEQLEEKELIDTLLELLNNSNYNLLKLLADNREILNEVYEFEWYFLELLYCYKDCLDVIGEFICKCREGKIGNDIRNIEHLQKLVNIGDILYSENSILKEKRVLIKDILSKPDRLKNKSYIDIEKFAQKVELLTVISKEMWDLLLYFTQFQIKKSAEPSEVQRLILEALENSIY